MTITPIVAVLAGTLLSAILSCLPGLHIYNIMAALFLVVSASPHLGAFAAPEILFPFSVGMVAGFAMLNTVPSILAAAPDESAYFIVLPGHKLLMEGRGIDAVILTAAGGLSGILVVTAALALLPRAILPGVHSVLRPHMHWIVWCVIAFMVMSEWPKGGTLGQSGWRRFADSWKTTGAGIVTFALAGLLGCIMFHRSPLSPESSFQNLMPVFTGLFTIPALLLNVVSRLDVPKQATAGAGVLAGTSPGVILTGSLGGVMGGAFAAFVPAVTGGVGGMLAGHATAVRDDRVFLVSQGASKCVYYVGGLLLLFVPGLNITRGCGAAMVTSLGVPGTIGDFHMALGCAALAAAVAYMLTGPLARAAIGMIERFGSRRISAIALAGVAALVLGFTGIPGLGVATVATGIGLLPLLYGSRRMNCLSVVLLPMALDMSGMGPAVMEVLGL